MSIAKKVLLIDDEPDVIEVLRLPIEAAGYQCFSATEPVSGIKLATLWHPDVIILDLNMPRMTGFEVMKELKNNASLKQIPIIAYTALAGNHLRKEALAMGAADFIEKIHGYHILLEQIAQLIRTQEKTHPALGSTNPIT